MQPSCVRAVYYDHCKGTHQKMIFSVYFRLFPCRNNFWLFQLSLSYWTEAVGTIIFPLWVGGEQFFFLHGLEFIETFNYKSFLNKNSYVRESYPGRWFERRRSYPLYHECWIEALSVNYLHKYWHKPSMHYNAICYRTMG
jgi:hypothetical protein